MAFESIKEKLGRLKSEKVAGSEEELRGSNIPSEIKTEMFEEIERLKRHSPMKSVTVRDEDYRYTMTIEFAVHRKGGKKEYRKIHRDYPKNSKTE